LIFRAGPASGIALQLPTHLSLTEEETSMDAPMATSLIARAGPMLGLSFALNESSILIGRDPASKVVLPDQTASWQHASLKQENRHWFVKDLGSSNGTWLNNERLEPHRLYPIKIADQLRLGDTLLEVI
jgi:pSer/pThr/pTyr-binding forkhead associated (FHA) protein